MAKGRSGKSHSDGTTVSAPSRRGYLTPHSTARPRLLTSGLSPIPIPTSVVTYEPLVLVEDRRLFHFDGPARTPLEDDGRPARITLRNKSRPRGQKRGAYRFGPKVYSQTKAIRAFEEPRRVLICVRRQSRKEVLFAKRKAGRGGMRPPRRNYWSSISCKR